MVSRPTVSINDTAFGGVQVLPQEPYRRTSPTLINAPENIRASVQSHIDGSLVMPPDGRVGRVSDAIVIKRGILTDSQLRIIAESLINMDNQERFETETAPSYDLACRNKHAIEFLPPSHAPYVMMKQTWDANYGHWLIESLPRLEAVKQKFGLDGLTYVVSENASPEMRTVYVDSLAMMGVNPDRIILLPDETRRISDVIYPTPLTIQPWVKSPAVIRILEDLRNKNRLRHTAAPERIFVSRNGWRNRRLLNEDMVFQVLKRRGYVIIQPETLNFAEQISTFSMARLVIGTLGAALSNIVFSQDGVKLLTLAPEQMGDDFFWDLVSLKNGHYTSIHGLSDEPSRGMHSDFRIDIATLEKELDVFEG